MENNKCIGCFWWECFGCDGNDEGCDYFLGGSDSEYEFLYRRYDADVDEALQPVYEKWKAIFEERCKD